MMVFVDTSAIVASLNSGDHQRETAVRLWTEFLRAQVPMITTNYVIVESLAVARGRLGSEAVRAMIEEIFPLLRVEWIDEDAHRAAAAALLVTSQGGVSMVDLTSFEIMRRFGLRSAFTFDRHFRQYGFETVPSSPKQSRHG